MCVCFVCLGRQEGEGRLLRWTWGPVLSTTRMLRPTELERISRVAFLQIPLLKRIGLSLYSPLSLSRSLSLSLSLSVSRSEHTFSYRTCPHFLSYNMSHFYTLIIYLGQLFVCWWCGGTGRIRSCYIVKDVNVVVVVVVGDYASFPPRMRPFTLSSNSCEMSPFCQNTFKQIQNVMIITRVILMCTRTTRCCGTMAGLSGRVNRLRVPETSRSRTPLAVKRAESRELTFLGRGKQALSALSPR